MTDDTAPPADYAARAAALSSHAALVELGMLVADPGLRESIVFDHAHELQRAGLLTVDCQPTRRGVDVARYVLGTVPDPSLEVEEFDLFGDNSANALALARTIAEQGDRAAGAFTALGNAGADLATEAIQAFVRQSLSVPPRRRRTRVRGVGVTRRAASRRTPPMRPRITHSEAAAMNRQRHAARAATFTQHRSATR